MRERTVLHILTSGKSATSVAEELGIDTNTVCKWVRDYRRKNNLPSSTEAKTIDPNDTKRKVKELENRLRQKEKELAEERENVEILKKSLHIFMRAHDENARR